MVFVKAQSGPSNIKEKQTDPDIFTVQYFDESGNMTIRSGGTVAWRCNNPAAMLASPYSTSKDRHCIGTAGNKEFKYAVYPDYATGHEALIVMLRGSKYFHLTLRQASKRYIERDPDHIKKIKKLSGLDPDRTINSLDTHEFERYWRAIEQNEKWEIGREDFIDKWYITAIRSKHGVIYEFCMQQNGQDIWLSKSEAITLAEAHQLHAIVVHLKNGTCYLRSEYHATPLSSLIV